MGDKCHAGRESRGETPGRQGGDKSRLGDKWRTSGDKSHAEQSTQSIQLVMEDKWETSAKSCGPKHSEHPECTGRQAGDMRREVGDKCEIMRTVNPECLWQKTGQETNVKSCGPFQRSKNPSQVNLFGKIRQKQHGNEACLYFYGQEGWLYRKIQFDCAGPIF